MFDNVFLFCNLVLKVFSFTCLRRILGKSFWSSCVRFTLADLLTNKSNIRAHSIDTYLFGARELVFFYLPMICLKLKITGQQYHILQFLLIYTNFRVFKICPSMHTSSCYEMWESPGVYYLWSNLLFFLFRVCGKFLNINSKSNFRLRWYPVIILQMTF